MQTRQEPVLVDEFEVGLDRAKITKTVQMQVPEPHETQSEDSDDQGQSGSPHSSSRVVVESIKAKKHRAGLKIRKTLHIGRASDDLEYTTTALAGAGVEASGSRYVSDAPEPEKPTMKDFLHNPLDTVMSKISEQTDQQVAAQITAKEIPHGDEVDLIHASEAVERARDDTQRLLATKDLSRLLKERQATYARWTLDRHITKIRRLPRDEIKLRPRSDFEKHDPRKGLVTDWRAYGQNLATCMYLVVERRTHGNTMKDLREDIEHRENQNATALSLTELIVKEGDENWSDKLVEGLGPWLMLQLADLANFFESLRNFYEWRVPHRTLRGMIVLGIVTLATALVPMWLFVKTTTFFMGLTYFALYPIAVNFPEYRLLVSPAKRFLWNIPTHGEWAVQYVQAEGTLLARKSTPVASSVAAVSPTFDPEHDYNSYTASEDKTTGRLIVSPSGIRFVTNFGHNVPWDLQYDQLERIEKVDRIVTRNIPGKLQGDPGQDLMFTRRDGKTHMLRKIDKRDEAFSQMVSFSDIAWQVVW
ncbi:hypothetical protein SLS60_000967 [Paraconiothyrium brasiliense]|uniref:Uncharacterized protein n=1 Tax=Paraconiothyrium brasiliense TaxID=300254 RepID=A0ABR3S8B4_9PLEO